ncbi:L-lysine 6-monooxygenase [Francisella sp. Scap27]|uniref:lysine N(6)-hydroxylase/L-ornithine N(5)-oxygenase family protein n=1 Tax=Francisella sp. Scap27 TaxID=2589986 RepID=UPI0015BAE78C|nr:SidA/IucD/PvdA family monooxygenase [Francisella sp. Scap27]QLE78445.1 L-lysine 6-monooxygenase [Francisella sp. Scap27]
MKIYDVIGVGIGPFNLGLSALLEDKPIESIFFDKKESFSWHPGLMMNWATLQVPFLADLVTMVDPTSRFSFLNYLREKDRLYKFYFKENFFVPRQEYNDYCSWVATNCKSCNFDSEVISIEHENLQEKEAWAVTIRKSSGETTKFLTKNIVLGLGTKPCLPAFISQSNSNHKKVHHSGEYLNVKAQALDDDHITIIGSGQSAGEIFLDLMKSKNSSTNISWVTRSKGFFPMEYSKLGLEHFSPEYVDYFYNLSSDKKAELVAEQDLLYKGISAETISDIYDVLYEQNLSNCNNVELISNSRLNSIGNNSEKLDCYFYHNHQESDFLIQTDRVIAATGYKSDINSPLRKLEKFITKDSQGNFNISRDYQVVMKNTKLNIFVQNAEMLSHGVGTPDLGLGAYRSATIANELLQEKIYHLPRKNVFSDFGVPTKYLTTIDYRDCVNA